MTPVDPKYFVRIDETPGQIETDVYPFSKHPEWIAAEERYVFASSFGLNPENPSADLTAAWKTSIQELELLANELAQPETTDLVFLETIERLGLNALRDRGLEFKDGMSTDYKRTTEALQKIRDLTWQRIEERYETARELGSSDSTKAAKDTLRRIGKVLAGDGRGKHRNRSTGDHEVRQIYYTTLFRLHQAEKLWNEWWNCLETSEKKIVKRRIELVELAELIEFVAQTVDLPEEVISLISPSLAQDGYPLKSACSIKEAAKTHTAALVEIAEPAVSNILSRRPRGLFLEERRS